MSSSLKDGVLVIRSFLQTLLFVSVVWIAGFLSYLSFIPWKESDFTPTQALIVFTGGSKRISYGLKLLQEGKVDRLYISGVKKKTTLDEILLNYPTIQVDTSKIILGDATNTQGNIIETMQWLKHDTAKDVTVLTSYFHIPRVRFLAYKQGLTDVKFFGLHTTEFTFSSGTFQTLLKEYHKILYHLFRSFYAFFKINSF